MLTEAQAAEIEYLASHAAKSVESGLLTPEQALGGICLEIAEMIGD